MLTKLFRPFFLLIVLCFYLNTALSQRVEISRVFLKNAKVHVIYDLIDDSLGRAYQMQLYGSKDNYISPLKKTTGAVGVEVYPGKDKEIIWDPFAEFGEEMNEALALEVRGRVYIPFVELDGFNYESLKRGKTYELSWTGGSSSNILNIDIFKGSTKVASFPNVANVGSYELTLPKKTKVGDDYRLRISDQKNKDDIVFSDPFRVKRKIPLVLQIAPVVIAGGGIYFLVTQWGLGRGSGDSGPRPIENPFDPS